MKEGLYYRTSFFKKKGKERKTFIVTRALCLTLDTVCHFPCSLLAFSLWQALVFPFYFLCFSFATGVGESELPFRFGRDVINGLTGTSLCSSNIHFRATWAIRGKRVGRKGGISGISALPLVFSNIVNVCSSPRRTRVHVWNPAQWSKPKHLLFVSCHIEANDLWHDQSRTLGHPRDLRFND